MRRRFMGEKWKSKPLLVELTNISSGFQPYTFEKGYRYADLLIVGGGGAGGTGEGNAAPGGGGGSGLVVYLPNVILSKFPNKQFSYIIAGTSSGAGITTQLKIGDKYINASGGEKGGTGPEGNGGNGASLIYNLADIISPYIKDVNAINQASAGGGASGHFDYIYITAYPGCSGGTLSVTGQRPNGSVGGISVAIADGYGGFSGGTLKNQGGRGYKQNTNVIPLKSKFGCGGSSGSGGNKTDRQSGGGGGAGGVSSGGYGFSGSSAGNGSFGSGGGGGTPSYPPGLGGQGIIRIYYHN